jgi:IclR family acetate operon transcriptional repressor
MASAGPSIAFGELAAHTELPQPTLDRLVRTLLNVGYVRQLPNRHYALGPKLIRLGERAARLIGSRSRPHLAELVERTGKSSAGGVGKALAMQLSDDALLALLNRTGMPASNENTHTTTDALMRDIESSRSRGYAVDEGVQEIGARCFAVPVPEAPTLTAISISGPQSRLTLKAATRVAPLLKRAARDLASEFEKEAAV